jgi:hypothetical protein
MRMLLAMQRQLAALRDEMPHLIRMGLMSIIKSPQAMVYKGETVPQTQDFEPTSCENDIRIARHGGSNKRRLDEVDHDADESGDVVLPTPPV